MENGIGGPFPHGSLVCAGWSRKAEAEWTKVSGQTLTNPGVPMFLALTLTTLVATGVTVNGVQIRYSDFTKTAALNDGDLVQPYWAISTNSIRLGIGANQRTFTCNLNVLKEIRFPVLSCSPRRFEDKENSVRRRSPTVPVLLRSSEDSLPPGRPRQLSPHEWIRSPRSPA